MANDVTQAFQTKFQANMLPALAESSEFSLPLKIARLEQTKEGADVIFYQIDAATAEGSMDGTKDASTGTAGDILSYKATIEPKYAYRKILATELNKTNLDLAGDFIKSFVRSVDRAINIDFLTAISDAKAGNEIGDPTLRPDEQIDEYIQACELASLRVNMAPDYAPNAVLVMNSKDYASLYRAEKKASRDYAANNERGMFYGCEVITYEGDIVPSGTAYVIPYGTTGFGYWETVEASATYNELFDGIWAFAKKSGGTVVIEPGAIEVIQSLPM